MQTKANERQTHAELPFWLEWNRLENSRTFSFSLPKIAINGLADNKKLSSHFA